MQWVVKGPGAKLGAQMFDRTSRRTPDTLQHLNIGNVCVYLKNSFSSGLGDCASPFLRGYDEVDLLMV